MWNSHREEDCLLCWTFWGLECIITRFPRGESDRQSKQSNLPLSTFFRDNRGRRGIMLIKDLRGKEGRACVFHLLDL